MISTIQKRGVCVTLRCQADIGSVHLLIYSVWIVNPWDVFNSPNTTEAGREKKVQISPEDLRASACGQVHMGAVTHRRGGAYHRV
jgi:hypothetical protein